MAEEVSVQSDYHDQDLKAVNGKRLWISMVESAVNERKKIKRAKKKARKKGERHRKRVANAPSSVEIAKLQNSEKTYSQVFPIHLL